MAEESTDFSRHTREHSNVLASRLVYTSHRANGNSDGGSNNSSAAVTPTNDRSRLIIIPSTDQAKRSSLTTKRGVADQGNGFAEDEANLKFYCGIGSFRPRFLRIFSNAKFFTFLLCTYAFIQGSIVSGERQGFVCFFPRLARHISLHLVCTSVPSKGGQSLRWLRCFDNRVS